MVMGIMHVASSTAPNNPKDPLAANYYTAKAAANNSTVDIERYKFLIGQLEKGTPLSAFEADAQKFVIDFNNSLIEQQRQAGINALELGDAAQAPGTLPGLSQVQAQGINELELSQAAQEPSLPGLTSLRNQGINSLEVSQNQTPLSGLTPFRQQGINALEGIAAQEAPQASPLGRVNFDGRELLVDPQSIQNQLSSGPLDELVGTRIPGADTAANLLGQGLGSVLGTQDPFNLTGRLTGALNPVGGGVTAEQIGQFGGEIIVPQTVGEAALEFIPGIGFVPDAARAGRAGLRAAGSSLDTAAGRAFTSLAGPDPSDIVQTGIRGGSGVPGPGDVPTPGFRRVFHGTAGDFTGQPQVGTNVFLDEASARRFADIDVRARGGGTPQVVAIDVPEGALAPLDDFAGSIGGMRITDPSGARVLADDVPFILGDPGTPAPTGGKMIDLSVGDTRPKASFKEFVHDATGKPKPFFEPGTRTISGHGSDAIRRFVNRQVPGKPLEVPTRKLDDMFRALADRMLNDKTFGGRPRIGGMSRDELAAAMKRKADEFGILQARKGGQIKTKIVHRPSTTLDDALQEAVSVGEDIPAPGKTPAQDLVETVPGLGRPRTVFPDETFTSQSPLFGDDIARGPRRAIPEGSLADTSGLPRTPEGQIDFANPVLQPSGQPGGARQWVWRNGNWDLVGPDDPAFVRATQSSVLTEADEVVEGALDATPQGPSLDQMRLFRDAEEFSQSPRAADIGGSSGAPPKGPEFPTQGEFDFAPGKDWRNHILESARAIYGLPRTIASSFDLSFPLRQGWLFANRPEWWQNLGPMVRAFADGNYADEVIAGLENMSRRGQLGNIHISPLDGKLSEMEEAFISKWAIRLPGVKQSQRAATTFINKLRADVYTDTMNRWARRNLEITARDAQDLGNYINRATGRGNLGPLEEAAPELSAIFFSARRNIGLVQAPGYLVSRSGKVRGEAFRDFASAFTGVTTLLVLGEQAGAFDVEWDPKSSDFGKIKRGKSRIDPWAGYQQMARLASSLITGENKAWDGAVREVNAGRTLWRFARSKFNPSTGLVADLALNDAKNFIGEDIDFTSPGGAGGEIWERMAPLFVQDFVEAIREDQFNGAAMAIPAFFGTGFAAGESRGNRLSNEIEFMGFTDPTTGEPITDYFKLSGTQKRIARESNPEILKIEQERDPSQTTLERTADMEAAWEVYQQTGDLDRYFKEIENSQGKAALSFASVNFTELKNPSEFNRKVTGFFDELDELTNEDERTQHWEDFEAGLNPEEKAAWKESLLGSDDKNYETIKRLNNEVQEGFWNQRGEEWAKLADEDKQFAAFEDFGDVFANTVRGNRTRSIAGKKMEQIEAAILKENPRLAALLFVFGEDDVQLSKEAIAELNKLISEHNLPITAPE